MVEMAGNVRECPQKRKISSGKPAIISLPPCGSTKTMSCLNQDTIALRTLLTALTLFAPVAYNPRNNRKILQIP